MELIIYWEVELSNHKQGSTTLWCKRKKEEWTILDISAKMLDDKMYYFHHIIME
jgi:hypothetical protein